MSTRDRSRIAENRALAVRLREAGAPYRSIARQLDVSVGRAHQLVMEALAANTVEAVDSLRQIESQRLDAMQAALWPQALSGNVRAIDTLIRLSARRARLLGLDTQQDITVVTVEYRERFEAEFDRLVAAMSEERP